MLSDLSLRRFLAGEKCVEEFPTTMKVQLLLPLALAGLLCSFTHASPTTNPQNSVQEETTTLEDLHTRFEEIIDIGTLPTVPQAFPEVVSTAGPVDATEVPTNIFTPTQDPIPDTTVVVTEAEEVTTEAEEVTASSLPPAEITLLPTSPLPEILTTESTEHQETDGHLPEGTESPTNSGTEGLDKTNAEEFLEDGPGTGQIVGIVIGAIVAVVIVIAVVIAVLRRMGKYSP